MVVSARIVQRIRGAFPIPLGGRLAVDESGLCFGPGDPEEAISKQDPDRVGRRRAIQRKSGGLASGVLPRGKG